MDKKPDKHCSGCWSALDDTLIAPTTQALALAGLERLLADAGTREGMELSSLLAMIRANIQDALAVISSISSGM